MWLLNAFTHRLEYFEGVNIPDYAILSHRWETEEVLFKDVQKRRHASLKGWKKIEYCCQQTKQDDLQYVWVDTCCIDKKSSAELSEAINSMWSWYAKAQVCYAYLGDVCLEDEHSTIESNATTTDTSTSESPGAFSPIDRDRRCHSDFRKSAWFTRGWTLQELLAPVAVEFYDSAWQLIGSRTNLASDIETATGINSASLCAPGEHRRASVAEKMSWAVNRRTTRIEDRAYSLLGLFDVNMPLLYGEGEKAFGRLLDELAKTSSDLTIFAWSTSEVGDQDYDEAFPGSIEWYRPRDLYRNLLPTDCTYTKSKSGVYGTFFVYPLGWNFYVLEVGILPHLANLVGIFVSLDANDTDVGGVSLHRVILDGQDLVQFDGNAALHGAIFTRSRRVLRNAHLSVNLVGKRLSTVASPHAVSISEFAFHVRPGVILDETGDSYRQQMDSGAHRKSRPANPVIEWRLNQRALARECLWLHCPQSLQHEYKFKGTPLVLFFGHNITGSPAVFLESYRMPELIQLDELSSKRPLKLGFDRICISQREDGICCTTDWNPDDCRTQLHGPFQLGNQNSHVTGRTALTIVILQRGPLFRAFLKFQENTPGVETIPPAGFGEMHRTRKDACTGAVIKRQRSSMDLQLNIRCPKVCKSTV